MHPDQSTHSEDPESTDEDDDDQDRDNYPIVPVAKTNKKSSSSFAQRLEKTKENVFSFEAQGLFLYFAHQAKHVLLNPRDFFKEMHTEGGLIEPSIFLCIAASIYGIFEAIGHLNPIVFFQTMLSSLFFVYVGAIIVNFALKAFGGKSNYEGTFRVLAFSKATLLFAWVSVASFSIGGFLALGYTIYLNIIGCKKVHQLGTPVTAAVIITLAILQMAIKTLFKI